MAEASQRLETEQNESWYFVPRRQEIISVLLTGLGFGVVLTALWYALDRYVISILFCATSTTGLCNDTSTLGFNIALAISVVAAVAWLAYQRVFRPALVVLPLAVIVWSLPMFSLFAPLAKNIFEFGLFVSFISIAAMLCYYWLVRIRSFIIVAIMWLVLTLCLRWFIV
jgi:hypothetical protein